LITLVVCSDVKSGPNGQTLRVSHLARASLERTLDDRADALVADFASRRQPRADIQKSPIIIRVLVASARAPRPARAPTRSKIAPARPRARDAPYRTPARCTSRHRRAR
jgi:hypothetical protein